MGLIFNMCLVDHNYADGEIMNRPGRDWVKTDLVGVAHGRGHIGDLVLPGPGLHHAGPPAGPPPRVGLHLHAQRGRPGPRAVHREHRRLARHHLQMEKMCQIKIFL